MRSHKPRRFSIAALIAEFFGVLHFVVVNVIFALGALTDLFDKFGEGHPGLAFVSEYIDSPLASTFRGFITQADTDPIIFILAVECFFIAASLLYGIIAYVILKIVTALLG